MEKPKKANPGFVIRSLNFHNFIFQGKTL